MNSSIKSLILPFACLIAGMVIFASLRAVPVPPAPRSIWGLAVCAILFFMSRAFVRYEKLSLSDVHLNPNFQSLARFGQGLLIGTVIVTAMLVTLFSLTDLSLTRVPDQSLMVILAATSAIIPLALMEELLFRGYPFFRLTQMINIRWVILITAFLFAMYHYNGSQSVGALLLGPGIWGVVFAIAAYFSKSIAVPLGIHVAANLMQAIFGFKDQYSSIWTFTKTSVPTTSAFDVEVLGLIMQIALLVIAVVFFEWFIRRKDKEVN